MEELLKTSTDDNIRGQSRQMLAEIYGSIGEKEKQLAIAEKCGSIHWTKEEILSHSSTGEDGIRYKQAYLQAMLTPLQNTLRPLAYRAGENAVNEAFTILFKLHELIFRDDCGIHSHWLAFLYSSYARSLIDYNKPDETVKAFKQSFIHAKKFAEFASGISEKINTSPFTDLQPPLINYNPNPNSEVRQLLDILTNEHRFKVLHENADFAALVKEVENWLAERG
jgi:hypothetical protein